LADEDHPGRVGHLWHDLLTLSLASQNTAIANARAWLGKGVHAGDERCGMAGPSRDNVLDVVVAVSGKRSGCVVPAITMPPWVAEEGV